MAFLLFVDESGQDQQESPYEVLAGVAVEDRDLWNMIQTLHVAEQKNFGTTYRGSDRELKARKLLTRKVYRLSSQLPQMPLAAQSQFARRCLEAGESAGKQEMTALAQAKINYVREALQICQLYHCKAFASIVPKSSPRPLKGLLRKDYAYLFERFFYFLEDMGTTVSGLVVFDELDKSKSHILTSQMDRYFKETQKGRQFASQVIPEPFYVHSDLTTGIQLADLVAYIISQSVRLKNMNEPARLEMKDLANMVCDLRYLAKRDIDGTTKNGVWSFAVITDLRPKNEK